MRRTANHVAMTTGRLLPHLFTLTPIFTGAVFSVTLLRTYARLPVRKHGALYCPDFPPRRTGAIEQPAKLQIYKINQISFCKSVNLLPFLVQVSDF